MEQLNKDELEQLIKEGIENGNDEIMRQAGTVRAEIFGNHVFVRGLIEISNHCKQNCFYCGIRKDNKAIARYRLTKEQILSCCEKGFKLGLRTFVLQGGEDDCFDVRYMTEIISEIRGKYPECAITLSLGEKDNTTYREYFNAGANRYLLRHESANVLHYSKLHPKPQTLENRKKCLYSLKNIGFQVGAGFMVGSPFQTPETLADDILFLKELEPHMVGIGPFIPSAATPFKNYQPGTLKQTLFMISLVRVLLPFALMPSTTALGSISSEGQELGLLAGANVVMPNLSPSETRANYAIYDNKVSFGSEAAEGLNMLENKLKDRGFYLDYSRGDSLKI